MKKVNVIGTTGSGKSTFSELLANKLNCPYIQMDQLYWQPNWVESTDDAFFPKVRAAVSTDSWILDGNYSRTNDIKWENADTIIWLDFSYLRTFFQLFKRTVIRVLSKQELWLDTGNAESFRRSFMSKKSIFIWFFLNYKKNKAKYAALMNSSNIKHVEFIRLRSPKEADRFLRSMNR
ncbi:MAG: adenylate kinase [Halomonas sp.]|uniref:adenylate kinase n=1 Tax=Halomonas sp. TaxID=1486246 RepID=UPI003F9226B6